MSDKSYQEKYLKYKHKYLQLKNQEGGAGFSFGIGYMLMTPEEVQKYNDIHAKEISLSKRPSLANIKKVMPKFKLTNLKTLKNINYNSIIGPGKIDPSHDLPKKSFDFFSNKIHDLDFIKGENAIINDQIKQELKVKDNKSELVIFTLIMPYLLYSNINYDYNIVYNAFVLK
jgi:hypothetical protein